RNLHVSFENYLQDNKMWPPQPDFSPEEDEQYENWWLTTMAPYTASSKKIWQCPLLVAQKTKNINGQLLKMHYSPTMFDANPLSPHRWAKHPWMIEIANAHKHGPLVLMPDGSVGNFDDIVNFNK
ncbi:MAG: hypothetical protein ABIP97_04890, partial [Chthoniobacterales bacterium]